MRKALLFFGLFFGFSIVSAQENTQEKKDNDLPEGNEAFSEKKYDQAEADYRVSQSKNPKKAAASYNLGNSIYRQKQMTEAMFAYAEAAKNASTRAEKHKAYHNLGNALMQQKNYQEAVRVYKEALINDPSDEETRYNYALAKKMLKENPPKDNKDKKDQKKNDKNKEDDKGQDKKGEKEKEKKDDNKDGNQKKDKQDQGNNPNQPNKQPQPKPGAGTAQQRMENVLDAVNNEEKKVQDKVKARQFKGKPVKTEKDW